MVQAFHAGDLSLHSSLFVHIVELVFGVDFDRDSLFGKLVLGKFHCCIGPLAKVPDDQVIVQARLGLRILISLGNDTQRS